MSIQITSNKIMSIQIISLRMIHRNALTTVIHADLTAHHVKKPEMAGRDRNHSEFHLIKQVRSKMLSE